MPDREKVINDLQDAVNDDWMWQHADYYAMAIEKALVLLKEQEVKPPAIMQDIEGIWLTCSICGHKLHAILAMKMDTYFPKFCSECGQAVKWE